MNRKEEISKLVLPTLRGKMGDWIYYVTLMQFKEVATRISLANEIHKSEGLSRMIQRKITNRTKDIVEYLNSQDQRFFNSLILGIYDGKPHWQEINIDKKNIKLDEEQRNYLNRTFGVLTLNGDEKIFAIDGQHRSKAIKDSVLDSPNIEKEEIAVIFVGHKTDLEGEIRTRRLFSTLNRYAKPVSKSEIIALDEEDNCAIITRNIVEFYPKLKDRILFNQNRSISPSNKTAYTNVILLYDIIQILITNINVFGISTRGVNRLDFIKKRGTENFITEKQQIIESIFDSVFSRTTCLKDFIEQNQVNREEKSTSLLFRPIGQIVYFSVIKVCLDNNMLDNAIDFFENNDFSLSNPTWNRVFVDEETGNIKTEKSLQKYAFQLILKKIGIEVKLTKKDKDIHDSFNIIL
jgi:DNA sulfur modification protein DndB